MEIRQGYKVPEGGSLIQRRQRAAPIAHRFPAARLRTRQRALHLDRPLKSWRTRSRTDALYRLSGCCNSG